MSIRYRLAHYEITDELGHGGMGVVYHARDTLLGRAVAIKVLPALMQSDPERRGRFVREARAAAALNHPNIATVYEVGEAQLEAMPGEGSTVGGGEITRTSPTSCLYIAMEYVAGEDLHKRLVGEPMQVDEALNLAVQMADALDAAHHAGVIHRDLKPRNIRVTVEGRVKILDFGLAKVLQEDAGLASVLGGAGEEVRTIAGMIVGTVPYMAPEQVEGKEVDARSDLFAFGVVLYQMLTGHVPFDGAGLVQYVRALSASRPDPPSTHNPAVPIELDRIVTRLLARESGERYVSAGSVLAALRGVLGSGEVLLASRTLGNRSMTAFLERLSGQRWALTTALLLALAGASTYGFWRWERAKAAQVRDTIHISSFEASDGGTVPSWCSSAEFNVRRDLLASEAQPVLLSGTEPPGNAKIRIRGVCQQVEAAHQLYVVVEHGKTGEIFWDELLEPRAGIGEGSASEVSFLLLRTLRTMRAFEELAAGSQSERMAAARLHLQGIHRLEAALEPSDFSGILAKFEDSLKIAGSVAATHARISEAIYWSWRGLGDDAEARFRSEVTAALDADPDDPEALLAKSRRLELDGKMNEAAETALAVVAAHPELAQAHQQAGWRLRRAGRLEEARDAFLKAVRLRPGFWRYWNDLGTLMMNSFGDSVAARDAFEEAVELSPESAIWLVENLSTVALDLADLDEAERHLSTVPEHRHTGSFANARGRLRYYQSRWREAAFDFRRATRMEPANSTFRANLGDAEWKLGEREKALASYGLVAANLAKGIEGLTFGNVVRRAVLRTRYASTLARMGNCVEALAELEAASAHLPVERRSSTGWFHLAGALCRCGSAEEATELARRALQLGGINHLDLSTAVTCENLVDSDPFAAIINEARSRSAN